MDDEGSVSTRRNARSTTKEADELVTVVARRSGRNRAKGEEKTEVGDASVASTRRGVRSATKKTDQSLSVETRHSTRSRAKT